MLAQGVEKPQNPQSKCPPCGGDLQHCYAVVPPGNPIRHHAIVKQEPRPAPVVEAVLQPQPIPLPCCAAIPEKPLQTWADAEKERADTDKQRLQQVEVPAQNTNQFRADTERMLAEAQIGKINAETGLIGEQTTTEKGLLPLREKAMVADTGLVNMRAGYLKHDHLWQLLYHMTDGAAFGMGMSHQNVAGINVQNNGGGASVSNSGNATATGGQGGAGGSSSSSSSSASQSNSSSKSESNSNSSAAASAASQ